MNYELPAAADWQGRANPARTCARPLKNFQFSIPGLQLNFLLYLCRRCSQQDEINISNL
jgi:hypothetical protein